MFPQIGFSVGSSLISKLICWLTCSTVSHVFVIFFDPYLNQFVVFESGIKGAGLVLLDEFKKRHNIVKIFDLPVDITEGISLQLTSLQKPYDFAGLIGMGFVEIGKRFFKKVWKNPFNTNGLWCSELVTKILQSSNFPGSDCLISSTTSPKDLYVFLSGLN